MGCISGAQQRQRHHFFHSQRILEVTGKRWNVLLQQDILAGEVMRLALSRCYETSVLHLPDRALSWNCNGDLCEKDELQLQIVL